MSSGEGTGPELGPAGAVRTAIEGGPGPARAAEARHRVRVASLAEMDDATISAWRRLEERALEPNAFLSPLFVLPAVRHLVPADVARGLRFVLVERGGPEAPRLDGVAVLGESPATAAFPLPHVQAFRSVHSFLAGFLLDHDEAEPAARALFDRLHRAPWVRHGIAVDEYPVESLQAGIVLRAASAAGFRWCEWRRRRRATLAPATEAGEAFLAAHLSGHRLKKLRRSQRLLEAEGPVTWRLVSGADVDDACIERFLRVEHDGWKGNESTSLLSSEGGAAFTREAMRAFAAAGRLFFAELLVGGEVVASTSNFVSGGAGFAFKVGWSSRLARAGPGVLNEVEFVRQAPAACDRLAWIDSGAAEGSFIETLWTGRRELARGTFARTPLAGLAARGAVRLRSARDWWRRGVSSGEPPPG
jgi:CelD/BcsL family acetyltransferase involved in cellulose biosynthesis